MRLVNVPLQNMNDIVLYYIICVILVKKYLIENK